MKTSPLAVLLLLAGLASASADQDKKNETREVRVYLLDRSAPERDLKDAVAVLTLEQPTGRGRTFLLPRVAKGTPTPGEDRAPGMIRGLAGTSYFVELQTGESGEPARAEQPEEGRKESAPPPGREVRERIHRRGIYFAQKIPAELVAGTFTATVTIRLGNLTFSSEEFQGPRTANEPLDEVAAKVDQSLATLKTKAEENAGFMDLKPTVVRLKRELSQLAPAGFEDGTGAFEQDRQWCLAMARRIDDACDKGDDARVRELSLQCGPRLKDMKSMLGRTRKEAAPTPEVPTVK